MLISAQLQTMTLFHMILCSSKTSGEREKLYSKSPAWS